MFLEITAPLIFAHRGASAYAPENTMAAFELAVQQGADAIELDAKLSADGEVVVIHDQTVDRTTEGTGKVKQLTLQELKKLDAGSHFDISFQGEKIPTLSEVFEAVGRSLLVNVELTNIGSPFDDLPQKTAQVVKMHSMQSRVLFSSFNPVALLRMRSLLPETPRGLLTLPGAPGALLRSRFGALIPHQALHPEKSDVNQKLVDRVHSSGRRINVYTVNEEETMDRLLSFGVDGIITDDPMLVRKVLAGLKN
jgi:glycerophosphoryl diester phosphodiesterase